MNRNKVLELAQRAGFNWPEISTTTIEERLERFAALIEREVRGDAKPVAFEFQHEDTGLIDFVDPQQVEWGFQKNNPRWQLIGPVFRHPAPSVVRQLVEALEQLMSIVKIYSRATSNNFAWAEMDFAKEALAAAKEAGL